MKIAIIGAGNVGQALGKGWLKVRQSVVYGVRNPEDEKYQTLGVEIKAISSAAVGADVIVLATPWLATEEAIRAAGDLSGKILVDCTNPLKPDLSGLTHGYGDSGGEQVARWAPAARVVKAFNTTGSNIMENPVLESRRAVMFVYGDDEKARHQVMELSSVLGFETVDAGPLQTARLLEPLALLWISAAYRFGLGRDFAFLLVRCQPS